ncbi:SDR family oxidoreductase [Roseateles sp. NT4]|uniref:SDR family oxidoreductase n=1 Tax=Roseateles sp. NT4 TaxID=3453715 RepID=UPI003EEB0219
MHVFVTGATGFIGSAIVQELLSHGHRVTGLARSEATVEALNAVGASAHRGDLTDLDSLKRGAAAADAVIHTAFNHDFSRFATSCEDDRHIIMALGEALLGSNRRLVVTSGTALVAAGRPFAKETDTPSPHHPRVASEQAAALAERGVKVNVVRLPPSVHGEGDHGFVPLLINLARQKGLAAFIGDGSNRWPAVHRLDAAELFRRVVEQGRPGASYHGSAETGVAFADLTAVIGRRLGLPAQGLEGEAVAAHFGWFEKFAAMDNPCSSEATQQELGWQPRHTGLLADVDQTAYFSS